MGWERSSYLKKKHGLGAINKTQEKDGLGEIKRTPAEDGVEEIKRPQEEDSVREIKRSPEDHAVREINRSQEVVEMDDLPMPEDKVGLGRPIYPRKPPHRIPVQMYCGIYI